MDTESSPSSDELSRNTNPARPRSRSASSAGVVPGAICGQVFGNVLGIGSASIRTRTRMATLAAENLVAALSGGNPPTPVNLDRLGK